MGRPTAFSEEHASKLGGIERADSVTIDGHKQLYLPMGIGVLALRDPKLAKAIEKQAPYILRANSIDLGKRSLEGSRPAMSLFLHAALNLLGRAGYEFLIDEGVRKTRHMANVISDRCEFELLIEPEMNILNYRYLPQSHRTRAARNQLTPSDNQFINHCNEQLQKAQRRMGKSFVSRTTLGSTRYGRCVRISVLRSVIANPLTTESDIDSILNEQVKIAAALGY